MWDNAPTSDRRGLAGRFLRGLASSPDRVAVHTAHQDVTYAELHAEALTLAGSIAGTGASVIGVLVDRSVSSYRAILAGLYAGTTVVPLQQSFPAARLRRMITDAGVEILVVNDESGDLPIELRRAGAPQPTLSSEPSSDAVALAEPEEVAGGDTAYILFTSGSTGRPKGVPVTHDNTAHYFGLLDDRYDFAPTDVFTQNFDLGFDCAFFDLFCAWGAGATLAVAGPHDYRDMPAFVSKNAVTVWFSTPSAIALVRRMGGLTEGSMPSLRWSLFAGEALGARDAAEWHRAASNSTVENLYGPTELTITIMAHRLEVQSTDDTVGSVPIGRLHEGHSALLLTPEGDVHPEEGELLIAGPQLTAGYLDSDDDAGRFFHHDGLRYYRTGDRVRRGADGTFDYLGRLDSQAQVRGVRVELAEVDAAVRTCPGVEDAVTVTMPVDGTVELAVFFTGENVPPAALARDLRAVLPAAVVPRRFTHLDEFPLNSNRKIDRRALAEAASSHTTTPRKIP
ncbi:AMP-binding protein [Rhodococcus sp. 14-2470-1a]|uniref:AMP-binding protein n=1 Tax=Rhodococcus sp. 14-2470-1a TaxID=2023150 RepID=UPI000B9C1F0A|nr:AMP-binding protein [Rhodococcus sp. 14-2470-1a]OZF56627.1 D-alanine--poly(phosphoribitol) ligase [Rhodococcus sp. 14-2470-1a]